MRTRTSFQKRQKEIARAEKQREKAAKRLQKKLAPEQPREDAELPEGESADSTNASAPPSGTFD